MQFNSYIFVLLFLPLTVGGYYGVRRALGSRAGNGFLAGASLLYYLYAGWECFCILLLSLMVNYKMALKIRRTGKRFWLSFGILFNTGVLLYFKYANFFILNLNQMTGRGYRLRDIVLPLGISFITFQQIAYLVNVYRKTLPRHGFWDYLLFVVYFPKLVMGPLTEPKVFFEEIQRKKRSVNYQMIEQGIRMFNLGLFKKLIFADTFAKAADWGFLHYDYATSMDLILAMLAYTFQIYFDFSGYSDMAIGISKMFDIQLPMNFDSPYKAYSIRDFWKRWHMSLTQFLTKYIYFPLGGNRRGALRTYLNMIIVFLVSGFWHGANWTFILWGALHGLLSALERAFGDSLKKVHQGFRWLVTFLITNVLWLLFRAESITQWRDILDRILKFGNTAVSTAFMRNFELPECPQIYDFLNLTQMHDDVRGLSMRLFFIIAFLICMLAENTYKRKYKTTVITMAGSAAIFLWALVSLGSESSFVYFGF